MRAGTVAMGFLVLAGGKFGNMRAHGVVDKCEKCGAIVTAALLVVLGLKAPEIGDEIRLPHPPSFHFRQIAPALAPLVRAAAVAVGEDERTIENVIEVAVAINDHRPV